MAGKDFVIEDGVLWEYKGKDKDVVIPQGVRSIAIHVFKGRYSLSSIIVPEGVTHIAARLFAGCRGLLTVSIPEGVTSIGVDAFHQCTSLENLFLPASLINVDKDAFKDCENIRVFQYPGMSLSVCKAQLKPALVRGFCRNPSVYSEERKAEYIKYMSTQKKKLLPMAVSENDISMLTAYDQLGIKLTPGLRDELINQAIQEQKTEILAFLMDYKKRTADFKKEAKDKERTEEQLLSNPYMVKLLKNDWKWAKEEDATIRILKYTGKDNDIIVPPFVGKEKVTAIGFTNFTFQRVWPEDIAQTINSITLPDSLTSIGDCAFEYCSSLTSIVIPDGVTSIGNWAFSGCTSLTDIVIPDSVTSIGKLAFKHTPWLNQQNDLIIINNMCIGYNGNDTHIAIPDGVTTICNSAFSYCRSLTSIVIPDSVTSIGDSAFSDCINLADIVIPDSVTSIGDYAFSGCLHLNTITMRARLSYHRERFLPKDTKIIRSSSK